MLQSHIINVLPRHILAGLWASQETRVSLSHLSSVMQANTSTTTTTRTHNTNNSFNLHHCTEQEKLPAASTTRFLCSELPVRYTHILRLLSTLTPDALQSPIIRHVAHSYLSDICTLLHPSLQGTSPRAFRKVLAKLRQRQAASLIRIRYALSASPKHASIALLDNINTIGFGIHLLLDQHLSWSNQNGNQAQSVCPVEIAQQAVKDAHQSFSAALGQPVPSVRVIKYKNQDLRLLYIPNVLHRILYEATLIAMRSQFARKQQQQQQQQQHANHQGWKHKLQSLFTAGNNDDDLVLHVFGGPTSIGFRLSSPAPLLPHDLMPDVPRDPTGIPTCAGFLIVDDDDDEEKSTPEGLAEWDCFSGWRAAKVLASHWGGNLDQVSVDGLGTSIYLALDRDPGLLERYPSRSLSSAHLLLRHHGRISAAAAAATASPLTLQTASIQLETFLNAIADQPTYHYPYHYQDHSVSLSAAVGHA